MAVNGIELKAGQTWRNRGGKTVALSSLDSAGYPFLARDEDGLEVSVNAEGRVLWDEDNHEGNLLALIADCGAPATELDVSEASPRSAVATCIDELLAAGPTGDLHEPGYETLRDVLLRAFSQAAHGKGKERHANSLPFEEQPMSTINRQLGSIDGFIYQAHKKSLEAKRLPPARAKAELLGAINYLAGAVIALDTWAAVGDEHGNSL